MPTYFWVPATSGAWSDPANWSDTPGGTTGFGPPTIGDDAFFQGPYAASFTVNTNPGDSCNNFYCTASQLTLQGDITVNANFNCSSGTYNSLAINLIGIGSLQKSGTFSPTGTSIFVAGIYSFQPSNVSVDTIYVEGTINCNSISVSTITVALPFASITATGSVSSNTISMSGPIIAPNGGVGCNAFYVYCPPDNTTSYTIGAGLYGSGWTFYGTTTFTSTAFISGSNTYNNVTFSNRGGSTLRTYTLGGDMTITGTLTSTGTNATCRGMFLSNTIGVSRTISAAATNISYADFRDITATGAGWASLPSNSGNCGGNTGISFPAAKIAYWNLATGGLVTAAGWALTPTGTPLQANFPLAQDTIVFTNSGLNSAASVSCSQAYNFGSFDFSARTLPMTLAYSNQCNVYGSFLASSALTVTSTSWLNFNGRGSQVFTTAGRSYPWALTVNGYGNTVTLNGAFTTTSTIGSSVTSGSLDTAGYSVSCVGFSSTGSLTRSITLGPSNITLTGTGSVWTISGSGTTLSASLSTITLSNTTTVARTFAGGGLTYGSLVIGGTTGISTLTIQNNNTFNSISSTKTVAHTISFTSGSTTTVSNWTVTGTVGNVVTITASSTTAATLTKSGGGTVLCNYMSISKSTATPGSTWYATNSTNGGTNTGWTFGPIPVGGTANFLMFFG